MNEVTQQRCNCEQLLTVLFSLWYLFTVQSLHRSFRLSETVSPLVCRDCQGRSEDDGREEGPVSVTFHSGSCGTSASTQLPFWISSINAHPSSHIHSYEKDASFLLNVISANELLYSQREKNPDLFHVIINLVVWFFTSFTWIGKCCHFIYNTCSSI